MRRLRRGRACACGVIFDGVRWGRVRGEMLGMDGPRGSHSRCYVHFGWLNPLPL